MAILGVPGLAALSSYRVKTKAGLVRTHTHTLIHTLSATYARVSLALTFLRATYQAER